MSGRTGRPRSRVQRLRRWLLAAAIVFAALLATLIGYTRYRTRKAFLNLPHQLGIDVKSSTDSFTISRTVKGRTLFTIHAAKAVQHRNGITTLRDVEVTLYGPPGSNRTDSIRGAEFEYDQANGVVRAMGDTLLDVGIVDGKNVSADAKRLTMQGKGLVFLQKLGVASTQERIRFQYGQSQGEAVGADYELDTGVLTLQHEVHLHSAENGHAEQIDAASAQLDRNTRVATLQQATLTDAADSMQAPHIVAHLRSSPDDHAGTLQRVDASGGVTLKTGTGQLVQAPELHADVTPLNQLSQVVMQGGVHLRDEQMEASAQRALLRFGSGHADHLTLSGQAHLQQVSSPGLSRTLDAMEIESPLQTDGDGHVTLRELHATGAAKLVLLQGTEQAGSVDRTELTSPALVAHMAPGVRSLQIHDLQASQGACLVQDSPSGERTSTSDTLVASFASATDPRQPASLQSVVQQGHVVIHEASPAKALQPGIPAPAGTLTRSASQTDATADRAEYQAATDLLVLTGTPHVSGGDGVQLSAFRIAVHRATGNADASGMVRGSIVQPGISNTAQGKPGTAESTQFASESAHLTHSTGTVRLQGGSADARLWSANGQIEAPVIEADSKANALHAFTNSGESGAAAVRTVLVQQSDSAGATSSERSLPGRNPTRIFSRDLLYRGSSVGKPGTAQFRGGVRLLEGDDVISADLATATLQPASAPSGTHTTPMLTSAVQSIAADGHVRITQGVRTATGSHLVYSVASHKAVLTGSPGAMPIVRDPVQGTLTGTELVLRIGAGKGNNQVEVTGAPSTPVHTELDVPEKAASPTQLRSRAGRKSAPTP